MNKQEKPKYVFGPVPSRRLGRSLGVDLIPFKTCTFDCIYCQIGHTTHLAIERREFVPMEDVLVQIQEAIARGPRPDYITMAGSGEPTLYSRLGELIDRIHAITDVPVDIITNGSTLWMDEVFQAVVKADLIVPSLDAGDQNTYNRINRSVADVSFEKLVAGLKRLSKLCPEKVWLEVLIVAGINDDDDQIQKITSLAREFNFARVQLNTAVRPPAEKDVRAVTPERLAEIAKKFTPQAEVVADFPQPQVTGPFHVQTDAVLDMLRRRPCTIDDIAAGLSAPHHEIIKIIEVLLRENKIQPEKRQDREYYIVR